jgi:hypothetical protein
MTTAGDAASIETLERGIRLLEDEGDGWMMCVALEHLAAALLQRGRLVEALETAQRAVVVGRESGSHSGHLFALGTLGRVLLADGQMQEGLQTTVMALGRAIDTANVGGIADALDAGAVVLDARGAHDPAVELLAMSSTLRVQQRVAVPSSVAVSRTDLVERLKAKIGKPAFRDLEASGATRTEDWAYQLLSDAVESGSA